MSKDESKPEMWQDIPIFHTNIDNVYRSLKRREGVHMDNTQSLTSKIIFHFCLSSSKGGWSVPQHPEVDFPCDALHNNEGLCVASCTLTATVVTSLSEDKAAAGRTEQQLAPCLFLQLLTGITSGASSAGKRCAGDTCSEGTGWGSSKITNIRKDTGRKLARQAHKTQW